MKKIFLVAMALLVWVSSALADPMEHLGQFGTWSVYRMYSGGEDYFVMLTSSPQYPQATFQLRIFRNRSQLVVGQPLAGPLHQPYEAQTSVKIDGSPWITLPTVVTSLATKTGPVQLAYLNGWNFNLIQHMQQGRRLYVSYMGVGQVTTYVPFSLIGFTKAMLHSMQSAYAAWGSVWQIQ